jgi:hypothetical protein
MADRNTRERKLIALMINDLGASSEPDAARIEEEVGALSDEELDRMLTGRLNLPHPVDEDVLDRALARVEEPEELSERGGFTGAPDMSHDPRPEERGARKASPACVRRSCGQPSSRRSSLPSDFRARRRAPLALQYARS